MFGEPFRDLPPGGWVPSQDWNKATDMVEGLARTGGGEPFVRTQSGLWFKKPEAPMFWAQITKKVYLPTGNYQTPVLGFTEQFENMDGTLSPKEGGLASDLTVNPYYLPCWEVSGENVPLGAYVLCWQGPADNVFYCHYSAQTWTSLVIPNTGGGLNLAVRMYFNSQTGRLAAFVPPLGTATNLTAGRRTITPDSMYGIATGNYVLVVNPVSSPPVVWDLTQVVATTATTFTVVLGNEYTSSPLIYPEPVWLNFINGYMPTGSNVGGSPYYSCRREDNDSTYHLRYYTSDLMSPSGNFTGTLPRVVSVFCNPDTGLTQAVTYTDTYVNGILVSSS